MININNKDKIELFGHRNYVGMPGADKWYGLGKLQYHFLVKQGLKHNHKFLDLACGSLRLGQYLIPYLDKGNYYGVDGEKDLVEMGIENEFFHNIIEYKKPKFSYNYDFNFSFITDYDYAIAHSLFTHLTLEDIEKCFTNLSHVSKSSSKFFFTFSEGDAKYNPTVPSNSHIFWSYSFRQIEKQSSECGWKLTYIGSWSHPKDQKIVLAERTN